MGSGESALQRLIRVRLTFPHNQFGFDTPALAGKRACEGEVIHRRVRNSASKHRCQRSGVNLQPYLPQGYARVAQEGA